MYSEVVQSSLVKPNVPTSSALPRTIIILSGPRGSGKRALAHRLVSSFRSGARPAGRTAGVLDAFPHRGATPGQLQALTGLGLLVIVGDPQEWLAHPDLLPLWEGAGVYAFRLHAPLPLPSHPCPSVSIRG